MARAGHYWDDSLCIKCYNSSKLSKSFFFGGGEKEILESFWKNLKEKKENYFSTNRYNTEFVKSQLMKSSEYRDKADEQGVIRPFLLIVSMRPETRSQIANELGWSLLNEKILGDPHGKKKKIFIYLFFYLLLFIIIYFLLFIYYYFLFLFKITS